MTRVWLARGAEWIPAEPPRDYGPFSWGMPARPESGVGNEGSGEQATDRSPTTRKPTSPVGIIYRVAEQRGP